MSPLAAGPARKAIEDLSPSSTHYKSKQPHFLADATARLRLEIDLRSFCSSTAGPLAHAGAWTRGRNGGELRRSDRRGLLTAEKGAGFCEGHPLQPTIPPNPERLLSPGGWAKGGGRPSHPWKARGGDRQSGQPSAEAPPAGLTKSVLSGSIRGSGRAETRTRVP